MRLTPLLLLALTLLGTHFAAYRIGCGDRTAPYDYHSSIPRFRVLRVTGEVEQLQRAENGFYWAPMAR